MTKNGVCHIIVLLVEQTGEMAEWFMALVLKTSDTERYRGFESLSLRYNFISAFGYAEVPKRPKGLPC